MGEQLLSTFVSLFIFTILGFFVTKSLNIPSILIEKILVGLALSNAITACISLFFPINIFVLLFLVILCSFLSLLKVKELKTSILSIKTNKYIMFCSLSFTLIAFRISLNPPDNYDSYLYHIQNINWIEEYSVVPGLANLHGRFGFNPNILILFALTSFHNIFKHDIYSLNFTVFFIVVFYFINRSYSVFKQDGFSNFFLFHCFSLLIILTLRNLSSPSPDFVSTVVPLFIFVRMLELSSQKESFEFKSYIPILILSLYIVTVKLATLPILLIFIFVFIKYQSEIKKSIWSVTFFASLIFIPWLIRNTILSGWLIFPFTPLDLFNFDWKVPVTNVINEKILVTGWARVAGPECIKAANESFIYWFPRWWTNLFFPYKLFFGISIIFPLIAFIGQLIRKVEIDLFTNAAIIIAFTGVIFWLFMAPEWRFGQAFILTGAMSPLLFLKLKSTPPYKNNAIFGGLLFLFFIFFMIKCYYNIREYSNEVFYSNCIKEPLRLDNLSNKKFNKFKVSSIDVYVPEGDDLCFDHCIPCTPNKDTTLVLRGNTLDSGFKRMSKK